jgi:hypothetical protein
MVTRVPGGQGIGKPGIRASPIMPAGALRQAIAVAGEALGIGWI